MMIPCGAIDTCRVPEFFEELLVRGSAAGDVVLLDKFRSELEALRLRHTSVILERTLEEALPDRFAGPGCDVFSRSSHHQIYFNFD